MENRAIVSPSLGGEVGRLVEKRTGGDGIELLGLWLWQLLRRSVQMYGIYCTHTDTPILTKLGTSE